MKAIRGGLQAGLVATIVVSMLMMIKAATGQFPELHVVRTLSGILGVPGNLMVGFSVHLFIGIVFWGIGYALIQSQIPISSHSLKGLVFGICAWLLMMVVFMPLAGAGLFAVNRGSMTVPLITLAYHLVFGIILGNLYAWNSPSPRRAQSLNAKANS